MTTASRPSREIDGKGRTVRDLLAGRKYSIDYYQREYKWQQKQLAGLIDDLSVKFLESHEAGNERSAVADYGHYFFGSIIISDKDGRFLDESGLPFRAQVEFRKADLDARQVLYQQLAERIWNPERLAQEAAS